MELAITHEDKVIVVERKGAVKMYNPQTKKIKLIATLPVDTKFEDGLPGVTLDPNFEKNHWIYFYNSHLRTPTVQHVSRFELIRDSLILSSEKVILKIPVQRETCCHAEGSLKFGNDGNLYISVGDNSNPFDDDKLKYNSNGYSPRNEMQGKSSWDAQRSSANTNDLRGKILRIKPQPDGTYTMPEGNLFSDTSKIKGLPEIYVMGCRNPFRISVDAHTNYLYWGDIGPDAGKDSSRRGPRGYGEINQAKRHGFFGWPYFIANNKLYKEYNYATGESGEFFNSETPINNSLNNA